MGKRTTVVWMVDDDKADHVMFRQAFEKYASLDFESFYSAESAAEALTEGRRPDLILLDVRMPGLGGFHLLDQRKDSTFAQIPVVVLSSSSDPNDVSEAYAKGANVYLQKPEDYLGLQAFIDVFLKFWFELALLPKSFGPIPQPLR